MDINRLLHSLDRAGSRRCLLAAAVAAPMVLLPGQVAEAKKKKNKGRAPGSSGSHQLIQLLIENITGSPIELEGWSKPNGCKKFKMETLTPPNTAILKPNNEIGVAAWINQTYLIAAVVDFDEFPSVQLAHGGTLTKECARGGVVDVPSRDMGIGQRFEHTISPFRFEVIRENDIGRDVVIRARIHPA